MQQSETPTSAPDQDQEMTESPRRPIDKLVRIFFYKSEEEPFDLFDGTLRVSTSSMPTIDLIDSNLVRYGEAHKMKDLRWLQSNQVMTHISSFALGVFCCADFLINPSTLYFDLPDSHVSAFI